MHTANFGNDVFRRLVLLFAGFAVTFSVPTGRRFALARFFFAVEVAVSSPCYHLSRSDAWLPDDPVMKRLSAVTRRHRRLSHTRMPLPCGGHCVDYRSSRVCRSRGGRQGVHRVQPRHASRR